MASSAAKKKAEQYLRDQAKIISKYGNPPKLHGEKYKEALSQTQRTFEILSETHESSTK